MSDQDKGIATLLAAIGSLESALQLMPRAIVENGRRIQRLESIIDLTVREQEERIGQLERRLKEQGG